MANMTSNVTAENYDEFTSFTDLVTCNAIAVLGLIGVVGNIASLVIWTRPTMKSCSSVPLAALAACDLLMTSIYTTQIYLLTILHYSPPISYVRNFILPHFYVWAVPVQFVAHTTSTFLTLALTLERYVAVCCPFEYQLICTHKRACKYTLSIIILSFLYNLPLFLLPKAVARKDDNDQIKYYEVQPTELIESPMFRTIYFLYSSWFRLVLIYLLPLTCISVLTALIYLEMKKSERLRMSLSTSQIEENNTTRMLVYVVFEFLVCSSVGVLYSVMEILDISEKPLWANSSTIEAVSDFFVMVNSSSNTLTYVIFSSRFRKMLYATFSCCSRFRHLKLPSTDEDRELDLRIPAESSSQPPDCIR